jgi:hypothetical protein
MNTKGFKLDIDTMHPVTQINPVGVPVIACRRGHIWCALLACDDVSSLVESSHCALLLVTVTYAKS